MRRPPPRFAGRGLFVLSRRIWRRPISWRGNEKAASPQSGEAAVRFAAADMEASYFLEGK